MSKKLILVLVFAILISLTALSIRGLASSNIKNYLPMIFREGEQNPPGRDTPTPQATATATPGRDTPTPAPTSTATATEIPPTATNTEIPPTATNTEIPPTATVPPCDYVCITYINNDPTTPDDLETEYVVIENFTDEPVQMFDWLLSNSNSLYYSFDLYILGAGESVRVWSKDGTDTQADLYWGLLQPAWDQYTGCGILYDQYNQLVDEYCY